MGDYSDAYIVVKGNIIVHKKTFTANDFEAPNNTVNNANVTNTVNNMFGEKNWFLKIMHLEYSKNYRKTTGSSWSYYRGTK